VIVLVCRPVKGIEVGAELNGIDVLLGITESKIIESRIDANHAIRSVKQPNWAKALFDDAFSRTATAGAVTATWAAFVTPARRDGEVS